MNIHFCPSFCSRLGCFILKHYAIFNYFSRTRCSKISDTIPVSCMFYDLLACFEGISAECHQAEGRQVMMCFCMAIFRSRKKLRAIWRKPKTVKWSVLSSICRVFALRIEMSSQGNTPKQSF